MKMILLPGTLLVRPLLTLALLLLAFFANSEVFNEENSTAPAVVEITAPKDTAAIIKDPLTAPLETAPVKAPTIPAKKTANNKPENTPDFIPSEEISEDLVVSFPVDI